MEIFGESRCVTGSRWWWREIKIQRVSGGGGVIRRATFFYMDDGLLASINPKWLQGSFDTLTGMFYRMGLWTNFANTFLML